MSDLTKTERQAYEAFNDWHRNEGKRVDREWRKEWDGSEKNGIAINDRQCDRIEAAKARLGITDEMMRRFRAMERQRWQESQECAA